MAIARYFKWLFVVLFVVGLMGYLSESGFAAESVVVADDDAMDSGDDLLSMSFEELMNIEVESAGFFKTTTGKAPGYVLVYDRKTLDDPTVRTLADLLESYVPGAVIGGHERQGRLIGVRGLQIDNNAKTLVMWDGQQINYRSHFGYTIGMVSPFLGDIDRVEVIHGPGAIQHGSGAISGFINMVPKTGTTHPGPYAHYEMGLTEQSNLVEGGYGVNYGEGRDFYIYGGGYDAKGFEPSRAYGVNHPSWDVDAFGYEDNNYRFSTTWNHDNFNMNWFIYSLTPSKNSFTEQGYFTNTTMGFRPKYTWEINETDSLVVGMSLAYLDFLQLGANGDNTNILGGSERHTEFKTVFKTTRFDNHHLAIGALYGIKKFNDGYTYMHNDPVRGFESVDTRWTEQGLFGEDVISLTDKLTMALGIRYDKYKTGAIKYKEPMNKNGTNINNGFEPDEMDGHWSPRIALAYELDEKTNLKLSYQHGFRMPDAAYYNWNLYNHFAAVALGFPPNPPLEPEEMDSFEFNLSRQINEKGKLEWNLFYNTFKNQLKWDNLTAYWTQDQIYNPSPAEDSINEWTPAASWWWFEGGMFQNHEGKYHIWGSELAVTYDVLDNLTANVSYGFAKVLNYNVVQRYPSDQIKLNLQSRWLNDKLHVGVNYLYNSNYSNEMFPGRSDEYKSSRNVFDVYAAYHINDYCRVSGAIKNVCGDGTPPSAYHMNMPDKGNIGYAEPRYYLGMELNF